jgi:hypothetical protein
MLCCTGRASAGVKAVVKTSGTLLSYLFNEFTIWLGLNRMSYVVLRKKLRCIFSSGTLRSIHVESILRQRLFPRNKKLKEKFCINLTSTANMLENDVNREKDN